MQPQPSCSGGAVGGAAGVRGKGGGVASWPGAVLGVVDAVSCGGGDRVGGNAELSVQGLVVGGGAVMFDADAAAGVTDDLLHFSRIGRLALRSRWSWATKRSSAC